MDPMVDLERLHEAHERAMKMLSESTVTVVPPVNVHLSTYEAYAAWLTECEAEEVERQRGVVTAGHSLYDTYKTCWDEGFPYHGAIAGGLTFEVTQTSLGLSVTATYGPLNRKFDLSESELW
jgi:hypothetical protein